MVAAPGNQGNLDEAIENFPGAVYPNPDYEVTIVDIIVLPERALFVNKKYTYFIAIAIFIRRDR